MAAGHGGQVLLTDATRATLIEAPTRELGEHRLKDIAAPDASQAQKFGLDKPEVEVTVLKGDGTEMAKLAIGRSEDKAAYVQSKSAPGVYVVDPATLDEIRKAPTDIPG